MPGAPTPPPPSGDVPNRARRWADTIQYWLIVVATVVVGQFVLDRVDLLPVRPPMLGGLLRTAALAGFFFAGVKLAGWRQPAVAARIWSERRAPRTRGRLPDDPR